MAAACGKLEVGLNPSLALGHLQMSRNPRLGSVLRAFLTVMLTRPAHGCRCRVLLLVQDSAPPPLADVWHQLSGVTPLPSIRAVWSRDDVPVLVLSAGPSSEL